MFIQKRRVEIMIRLCQRREESIIETCMFAFYCKTLPRLINFAGLLILISDFDFLAVSSGFLILKLENN